MKNAGRARFHQAYAQQRRRMTAVRDNVMTGKSGHKTATPGKLPASARSPKGK